MKAIIVAALFLIAAVSAGPSGGGFTSGEQTMIAQFASLLPIQGHQFSQPLERDIAVFVEIYDQNNEMKNFICLGEETTITIDAEIGSNNEVQTILSLGLTPAAESSSNENMEQTQNNIRVRAKDVIFAAPSQVICAPENSPKSLEVFYASQLTLNQNRFIAFSEGTFATLKADINGVPVSFGLNGHTIKVKTNLKGSLENVFEWSTGTHEGTNSTGGRAGCSECSYTPIQCPASAQQQGTVTRVSVSRINGVDTLVRQTVLGNSGCVSSGTITVVPQTTYIAPSGTSCPTKIKLGLTYFECFGTIFGGK